MESLERVLLFPYRALVHPAQSYNSMSTTCTDPMLRHEQMRLELFNTFHASLEV